MEIVKFLKKKFAPQSSAANNDQAPDKFGLRIGSFVSVQAGVFAVLDNSLIANLRVDMLQVMAISRIRLEGSDLEIRRYYFIATEINNTADLYLQIIGSNQDDVIFSINQKVMREYPEDEETLLAYQGKGYGLGESTYTLSDVNAVPKDLPELREVVTTGLAYQRDLAGGDYVQPLSAIEEMICDNEGLSGLKQRLMFMPYCRDLPIVKDPERLTISLVTGISRNHKPSNDCRVDFFAGIDVPVSKIEIIG